MPIWSDESFKDYSCYRLLLSNNCTWVAVICLCPLVPGRNTLWIYSTCNHVAADHRLFKTQSWFTLQHTECLRNTSAIVRACSCMAHTTISTRDCFQLLGRPIVPMNVHRTQDIPRALVTHQLGLTPDCSTLDMLKLIITQSWLYHYDISIG